MKKIERAVSAAIIGGLAVAASATAQADDVIKVGVVAALSGPFADTGKPMEEGIKAWLKEHGDTVAGKKIEVIYKDDAANPETTKRLAQELIARDHVKFLMGFSLTPLALATAPIATQSKTPMIVLNAATSIITTKSPYITRTSFTTPQATAPMAQWAARNKIKKVYTLVSDYGPGIDAETTFTKTFKAAGGQIVGSSRVPLKGPEFSAYLQKIKDSKPDAVFVFLPASEQGPAFIKGFHDKQMDKAGIKILGTGDMTEDGVIDAMGDQAIGLITSHHYSNSHKSALNASFKKAYAAVVGGKRANFVAAASYDGMHIVFDVVKKLNGNIDGDKAMEVIKHEKFESPRGPIAIDPATRDIVQNMYIRRVAKVNGHLYNEEFETIKNVKDPGK